MLKRTILSALLCVLSSAGLPAQSIAPVHRVLFVLTSPDREDWHSAMVLADHFLAGVKPEISEVEVLAYSDGIDSLKTGSPVAEEVAGLKKLEVHFVACENAMRAHHILKSGLLPGVTTVPSGVVELVRKQEAGWSYVKVGR